MKTFVLTFILLLIFNPYIFGYSQILQKDSLFRGKTLFENITQTSKKNNLLNVNLNTRIAFHTAFKDAISQEHSAFRLDYLRLQVTGEVNEWIYYKWMQKLNVGNSSQSLDNAPSSIDCLGVGFRLTPTLTTFIGKQYADFGGFEYDADPAEVYHYSEFVDYVTCFLVGINFTWQFTPTQELRFQITNNGNKNTQETYGTETENYKAPKTPLGYTLNWNGNFLNERLFTRSSFSIFHEGKRQNVYFLALAVAWVEENFNVYIDGMYSTEEIDKLGILSEISSQSTSPSRATHCSYLSLVSRINYHILPKVNLFAKGMYETASTRSGTNFPQTGIYRISYGYQTGLEYFPMKENLRFYILYRSRQVNNTHRSRPLGMEKQNPQYLSMGILYNIPIY